jgi:hypothetical protein
MDIHNFRSFCVYTENAHLHPDDLEKLAGKYGSMAEHATEIAGLGILAKPAIDKLRGKKMSEKKVAKHEIAGLGVLAAPSALKLFKHAGAFDRAARMAQQAKGVVSKAPAKLKMPGSLVRGKPMTGMKMHGLDRGALEPGKMATTAAKVKAQVG